MANSNPWDDRLLFGADYNPDQWLEYPAVLDADLAMMKAAHISVVSVGMFSWSSLEPREGEYQFDWLGDVLDRLHEADVRVFLATPSGARPAWMAERYPEVLRVAANGTRNWQGGRHNHCYTSPVYRQHVASMNAQLARTFGTHPAVRLWHVSNEYSGECHCDLCQAAFRDWLRARYGTLEELNRRWYTTFWSHAYSDWEQVRAPSPRGETTVHMLTVDWKRFTTHQTVSFMRAEIAALRDEGSNLPVTTNMMAGTDDPTLFDPGLNYWAFGDSIDVASWDSYPAWHMPGHASLGGGDLTAPIDDFRRASEDAFHHDLFRGLKRGEPFLLMESTPAAVNWLPMSRVKRPGMIVTSALHAIAHGANSVQYFQWRQSRGGFEKFHGAVVDSSGSPDRRVFREVVELGSLLSTLSDVARSRVSADVALVYDWENRWAFEESRGVINGERKRYLDTVLAHYYALWSLGVTVDVIRPDEVGDRYRMIVAPMVYSAPRATAERVADWIRGGGIYVSTYLTGYCDEDDQWFAGGAPGPFASALGLDVLELDAVPPAEEVTVVGAGEYAGKLADENEGKNALAGRCLDYQEYVAIRDPAQTTVLAHFRGGVADGQPAVTRHAHGGGYAYHIAGRFDNGFTSALYRRIVDSHGIETAAAFVSSTDEGVSVRARYTDSTVYLFVMNFTPEARTVGLRSPMAALYPARTVRDQWMLEGYHSVVLTGARPGTA